MNAELYRAIYELLAEYPESEKEEIREIMRDKFDSFNQEFDAAWETAVRVSALPEEG